MREEIKVGPERMRILGPTTASVKSHSNIDAWHAVDLDDRDGLGSCTCAGFTYRKKCRHLEAVRLLAAQQPTVELPLAQ